jgi:hypothetical protein
MAAGCGFGESDEDLVASDVETFEGDAAEARSCEPVGEAITADADYGATLNETWRCSVKRTESSVFADACYVVSHGFEFGVIRSLRCAVAGGGCPPGGRRQGQTVFLGTVIDPDLVLERERGNDPAYTTIRTEVFYKAPDREREHCGYLSVRVPSTQDPVALAADRMEGAGWTRPGFSFTYSVDR